MQFPYKKFGEYLRPVIPIKIKYNNASVGYEVLVDSGADLCIFDAEIKVGRGRRRNGFASLA